MPPHDGESGKTGGTMMLGKIAPIQGAVGRLCAVRVFCYDLMPARAYYAGMLGLRELRADGSRAVFDAGGVRLLLERITRGDPDARDLVGRFTALCFHVDDLDTMIRALSAKGAEWAGPPEELPDGTRQAHLRDPSGNIVTLVQEAG